MVLGIQLVIQWGLVQEHELGEGVLRLSIHLIYNHVFLCVGDVLVGFELVVEE